MGRTVAASAEHVENIENSEEAGMMPRPLLRLKSH
jgi:hypothetical protein